MSPARWLVLSALMAMACLATWKVDAWRYGKQLADARQEFSDYKSDIATAATKASEDARAIEQQRQRDNEKVRTDATEQKQKDDALAALQRADSERMRGEINKLLADRASLNSRLAERGKTIKTLPICLPSCDQKLMDMRESWRQRLQRVVGPDLPVSVPTTH